MQKHKIQNNICENLETCNASSFFRLIGRKWAYPIFCILIYPKQYSFEDIIKLTFRKVHRTSLSKFLKELINFGILEKVNKNYRLTDKGRLIQQKCVETTNEILKPIGCSRLNNL